MVECGKHNIISERPSTLPLNQRNHVTVEGVASTGQVSPKGTVKHREWLNGRVDGKANVRPLSVKLSEFRRRIDASR